MGSHVPWGRKYNFNSVSMIFIIMEKENQICKFCNRKIFTTKTGISYHQNRCSSNKNRIFISQQTREKLAKGNIARTERIKGKKKIFKVVCEICKCKFDVEEYEKEFPKKEKYYCSRKCSNKVGALVRAENFKKNGTKSTFSYRTICFKHHGKKCIICPEEKMVCAHHINLIHNDNRPENLVPLCRNHHGYIHSKYKKEVFDKVQEYLKLKWGP